MFNLPETDEIKRKNLYEAVADRIEYMMIDGTIPLGTKLPSEQSMADHFNVSRNVVREAYKTLQERGLIEIRNGEGAVVIKPEPSMITDVLHRMLALKSVDFKELYQFRSILEVNACKFFVKNITPEKLKGLKDIFEQMEIKTDDREKWVQLDLDFHRNIVKGTGNEIFYCFYKPVLSALRYIFTASFEIPGAKKKGIAAHRNILNAFAAGDENAASDYMEKHLSESLYDIESLNKNPEEKHKKFK